VLSEQLKRRGVHVKSVTSLKQKVRQAGFYLVAITNQLVNGLLRAGEITHVKT
jgi:hypothetical protein